jgi:hypothetical protein
MMGVRFDDKEIEALDGVCKKLDQSRSDAIREAVKQYVIKEGGAPGPLPRPAPAPQPAPAPVDPPAPGGGTINPPHLPELSIFKREDVKDDRFWFSVVHSKSAWIWWLPTLLVMAAFLLCGFSTNILVVGWSNIGGLLSALIGGLTPGRGFRLVLSSHVIKDADRLIVDIPLLWQELCLKMPPEQAELALLAMIEERRKTLGAAGVKDLGEKPWETPRGR